MPLMQTTGNVTADAYAGGVAVQAKYIENFFQTWLRTGTGSSTTVTTGLDASTNKALVWTKSRSAATDHKLTDTVRGATKALISDTTGAQTTDTNGLTAFSATGYTIGSDTNYNNSGATYVDWEFVATPKFFDVVTYTGNGTTAGRDIAHSLGSVPGFIIVKPTSTTGDWLCRPVSWAGTGDNSTYLVLNSTAAAASWGGLWGATNYTPTSTTFTVGGGGSAVTCNANGVTYVAYLFAHNAGGFGLTGTDNVISCGSFTTNSSSSATVNLGYEPQWVLIKSVDNADSWFILDNMRGWVTGGNDARLVPNSSNAEATGSNYGNITATGFVADGAYYANSTHIYIAIRRGPMKTPTTGTSVYNPVTANAAATPTTITFNTGLSGGDLGWGTNLNNANRAYGGTSWFDRLRGASYLFSSDTNGEGALAGQGFSGQTSWIRSFGSGDVVGHFFKRAPGFFDEVCYTGNGTYLAVNHNLGVRPELIMVKRRNSTGSWYVQAAGYGSYLGTGLYVNNSSVFPSDSAGFDGTGSGTNSVPTATQFYVGGAPGTNASSSDTYVAYLFASCPGVSKVTNFTGNGSTQTINCGFTGGARFVMIKATSTTGNWLVFDTARGMTTSTDPWLALNSTAAESSTTGACTTVSSGFAVDESKLTGVNTNGVSYIAFAVA